jgi:hypothetical protein
MSCFIKNIPRNSQVASGNRGIGFPTEAKDCYFESAAYDCFLALQESRNLGLLTVGKQQLAINCTTRINDCYVAMQEDGFTNIDTEETSTNYIQTVCS